MADLEPPAARELAELRARVAEHEGVVTALRQELHALRVGRAALEAQLAHARGRRPAGAGVEPDEREAPDERVTALVAAVADLRHDLAALAQRVEAGEQRRATERESPPPALDELLGRFDTIRERLTAHGVTLPTARDPD